MRTYRLSCLIFLMLLGFPPACKKMIRIDPPSTQLTEDRVFASEANAEAALINIYSLLGNMDGSIIAQLGAYTDELVYNGTGRDASEFGTGILSGSNEDIAYLWSTAYAIIYQANLLTKGLENNGSSIPPMAKQRIVAEAKVLRAYCFLLLVNCFGEVPLALSADLASNANAPRAPVPEIYRQVAVDLDRARNDLPEAYPSPGKFRVNKWVAQALLARCYLYMQDWDRAREASDGLIRSGPYTLAGVNDIMLGGNEEAIWQLWNRDGNSILVFEFMPLGKVPAYNLHPDLVNNMERDDRRKDAWTGEFDDGISRYHYPAKYKNTGLAGKPEYTCYLRLAEQYLIRAEALAMKEELPAALTDINVVRSRAGVASVHLPINRDSCLRLIEKERRVELFTEGCHRFFDLKRTDRIDSVMSASKTGWTPWAKLLPLPEHELTVNSSLTQNPGY